jgi:hypothetical protein
MIAKTKRAVARLVMMFGLVAVITGMMGFQAAQAEDWDFVLEVSSHSVAADEASIDANITNETRMVIDGATQVSWEVPDHNVNVSKKQLRKAPKFKIRATGANSSKRIFKKAKKVLFKEYQKTMPRKKAKKKAVKHAGVVILEKGSEVRNTGKENTLRVGFKWRLKYKAVLVFDKPSKQYRHAYNIRGGKLLKTCLNYIGGKVPMRKKVIQVRYEEDVKLSGNAEAVAKAPVTVFFNLTCPNGAAVQVSAQAAAYGRAADSIVFTKRTRAAVLTEFKSRAVANISVDASTFAEAKGNINIKAKCGDNPPPPPPSYEKPSVDVTPVACVEEGDSRDVKVTVSNPNTEADTARLTFRGQTVEKAIAAHGQATFIFTGVGAGTYSGTALLVKANKSASFTVTVAECETPPPADSLTISGWSSWHFIQDSDGGWNEVTAESNGATVGFSAPTVKSGPCAIVESSVVTHSATKKTQQIRVRPLTGQTGTCVIATKATAGSAEESWEGIIEIAPIPPGSWD